MWKATVLFTLLATAAGVEGAGYPAALAAYHSGDLAAAEPLFRLVAEQDEASPETIKARYFLARTLMKQRRFEEAASLLIDLHRRSPLFYREWACDFLLGQCRAALGQD